MKPGTRVLILTGFWANRTGRVREIRAGGTVMVDIDGCDSYTLRMPADVVPVREIVRAWARRFEDEAKLRTEA